MTEQQREALSALMDGEASELELRRTLKDLDSSPELLSQWDRYHMIRSSIKGDVNALGNLDITQAVSAAIADEEVHHQESSQSGQWFKSVASMAVAASVTFAVVLGWQNYTADTGVSNNQIAFETAPVVRDGKAVLASTANQGAKPQLIPSTMVQERLQNYMLTHTQNASLNTSHGMMPYARVVNMESQKK